VLRLTSMSTRALYRDDARAWLHEHGIVLPDDMTARQMRST
jgi:hypothetical protein